jgi:hypothetical protein
MKREDIELLEHLRVLMQDDPPSPVISRLFQLTCRLLERVSELEKRLEETKG